MKKLLLILSFISLPIFSMEKQELPKKEHMHACARYSGYAAFVTAYAATMGTSITVGL